MTDILWIYLAAVNVMAFSVFGDDKRRAKRHMWRVPESRLLLLAAAGGALGALLGMRCFHHKTRKPKFYVGVPVLLAIQIVLLALFLTGRSV